MEPRGQLLCLVDDNRRRPPQLVNSGSRGRPMSRPCRAGGPPPSNDPDPAGDPDPAAQPIMGPSSDTRAAVSWNVQGSMR